MKSNYHTHTTRCHHAAGSDKDYVLSAIKGGFTDLGFSDHSPWPFKTGHVSGIRMLVKELPGYVKSIKQLAGKYQDQIHIRVGLECEYYDEYIPWLKEIIEKHELDYLIFGNHFYKTEEKYPYFGRFWDVQELLKLYLESSIRGMESGLYSYFAHPDLFMRRYPEFDEHCEDITIEICKQSLALDVPLEYNLAGLQYNLEANVEEYPHSAFWEIAARYGCKTIIGNDAHNNKDLEEDKYRNLAVEFLEKIGANVAEEIRFLR